MKIRKIAVMIVKILSSFQVINMMFQILFSMYTTVEMNIRERLATLFRTGAWTDDFVPFCVENIKCEKSQNRFDLVCMRVKHKYHLSKI